MFRLASILYSIIGNSLGGTLVVVALVTVYDSWQAIFGPFAAGMVVGLPVTYVITKAILGNGKPRA